MHFKKFSTFMEINKIQEKGKGPWAQNGPIRPSGASRPAQHGCTGESAAKLADGEDSGDGESTNVLSMS